MVTKQIQMNISHGNQVIVAANKGESGSRFLEVSFVNSNNTAFDLSNKTVVFYAEKPDKMVIFNNCTKIGNDNEGKVLVEITKQTTAVSGVINCEFHIIENNSIILKVMGLKIISNESFFNEIEVISSSEFTVLLSTLQRAENALESAQNLIDTYDSRFLVTEKGSWTPTFYQAQNTQPLPSYSDNYRIGAYYRIGKICYITFSISSNILSASNAYLSISGLPYVSNDSGNSKFQYIALGENWGNVPDPSGAVRIGDELNYLFFVTPNSYMYTKFPSSSGPTCKLGFSGWYIIHSSYY